MLLIIFPNLVQQMMPYFVTQRALYEVRERPSKAYSWKAFMLASIIVELPWNILMAVPAFFGWYYPIGLFRNAYPTDTVTERGGTMFLLILIFMLFTSTFSSMIIAGIEQPETGGNIAQLLFSMCLIFNGFVIHPTPLFMLPANKTPIQSPRLPRETPRLLDLHVPRQSVYLPRFSGPLNRRSRHSRALLGYRTPQLPSSVRKELLQLLGGVYESQRRKPAEPGVYN